MSKSKNYKAKRVAKLDAEREVRRKENEIKVLQSEPNRPTIIASDMRWK